MKKEENEKSKLEELFEGYKGNPEDREVVDWGEDVGVERFWERDSEKQEGKK